MARGNYDPARGGRVAEAVSLYKAGWNVTLIAAKMRVTCECIRKYLWDAGVLNRESRFDKVGAVMPDEIEQTRQVVTPGMKIAVRQRTNTGYVESTATVKSVHRYIVRTTIGCYSWAEMALALRGDGLQIEDDEDK